MMLRGVTSDDMVRSLHNKKRKYFTSWFSVLRWAVAVLIIYFKKMQGEASKTLFNHAITKLHNNYLKITKYNKIVKKYVK